MAPDATLRARYGPCALVAGAAVGLGAEYARQLAGHGLDLLLLDRDGEALRTTAAEIGGASPVAVRTLTVELGAADLAEKVAPALADTEIGLLVYNAALGTVSPFLDMTPALLDAVVDVNCRGPLRLAHALVPAMVRRGRGGLILMSSLSGSFGSAQLSLYAASKAFTLVLGDALWAELRAHGVDVLTVQPGSTRTPGWLASQPAGEGAQAVNVMESTDVVREALDTLGVEPHLVPGEVNRQAAAALAGLPRRQVIELMSAITAQLLPKT
jgi:hypothetical protein